MSGRDVAVLVSRDADLLGDTRGLGPRRRACASPRRGRHLAGPQGSLSRGSAPGASRTRRDLGPARPPAPFARRTAARLATAGLRSEFLPEPEAKVGHCVHNLAMHPSRPDTLFMQKHWDVCRSDDAGDHWTEVSGNLPSDFGFPISVHAHEPETVYVVPILGDAEHYPPDGRLRVARSRTGGNEWELLTNGLPQKDCYVNVLRDAMAVDTRDSCGIYFGTTGGQVYASPDSGDSWRPIVEHLPAVLSVEVQTIA